jgi:hypothetical protein
MSNISANSAFFIGIMRGKFQFAIDRGGTFTDVWSRLPDGSIRTMKLLSEDPDNYPDAPREGIRRIIAEVVHAIVEIILCIYLSLFCSQLSYSSFQKSFSISNTQLVGDKTNGSICFLNNK